MKTENLHLRVKARRSKLSMFQVKELFSYLPDVSYELLTIDTLGDKNKEISLMDSSIPEDFFTRELDEALKNDLADIIIHSAKDLPYPIPTSLEVYCLTNAVDKSDALISRNHIMLDQLPKCATIGTSSITRKNELLKLRPDLNIVSIRGTIEERLIQIDNQKIDALIVATCALKRLGLEKRITEILPFKTHPLQGNLAVVGKAGNQVVKNIFRSLDIRQKYGEVTLVGFGPGNADLLTIGGDKALKNADVIFHDDLVDIDFLDLYSAEKIYVGKRKNQHSFHQDEINELLYQAAIEGKKVVRLKGGDSMMFAHGREEIDFLQSRLIQVTVIPGISSGIALAAYTHIPLTHRGISSSVSFVTGHSGSSAQTPNTDTIVYYMAGAKIAEIAENLIKSGRSKNTPVALVHNVSLPSQKTFYSTLDELEYSIIKYPTPVLVIVGEVVNFENKNCIQQVLITGTSKDKHIENNDSVKVVHTPLITVKKKNDELVSNLLTKGISICNWLIFTSRFGVKFFFEILDNNNIDIRILSGIKIASVGETTTKELLKYRIQPDIESMTESAEGIVNYFKEEKIHNKEILLPRSDKGLQFLSDELRKLGNKVIDIAIYENTPNESSEKVDLSDFQKIFFASPSGVDAYQSLYGELPSGIQIVAKGKTTKNKINENLN